MVTAPALRVPTILVAEDEAAFRRLLIATLKPGRFRILEAASAVETLRMGREALPDVILLDIGLGNDDGLRVSRKLKDDPTTRFIKIVVVSGHDDPLTRERARLSGADRFLAKPFSPLALWRALDALVPTG